MTEFSSFYEKEFLNLDLVIIPLSNDTNLSEYYFKLERNEKSFRLRKK